MDDLVTLAHACHTLCATSREQGDFTRDGTVNFDDLLILAQNYGPARELESAELLAAAPASFAADWALAQSLVPEPLLAAWLASCVAW